MQVAYVDQTRADARPRRAPSGRRSPAASDLIELGKREINSRAYVSSFNFRGSDQQKRVGDLSGGERNRLHLAKLLRSGGNLLLLDEPTNDLDVDTLRALEDALLDFAGCAVVISHDRWFLDRVATHILAFEGDSQVVWFEGAYDEYEQHRRERLGDEADPAAPDQVQAACPHLTVSGDQAGSGFSLTRQWRRRLSAWCLLLPKRLMIGVRLKPDPNQAANRLIAYTRFIASSAATLYDSASVG